MLSVCTKSERKFGGVPGSFETGFSPWRARSNESLSLTRASHGKNFEIDSIVGCIVELPNHITDLLSSSSALMSTDSSLGWASQWESLGLGSRLDFLFRRSCIFICMFFFVFFFFLLLLCSLNQNRFFLMHLVGYRSFCLCNLDSEL